MEREYFPFHGGGAASEQQILGGADAMTVYEAYILSLYNDSHLSYLSLLNSAASAASAVDYSPPPYNNFFATNTTNQILLEQKQKKENSVKSASEIARKRRQKIGEKTRCLQKLLPWNTKMDTATMLTEAAKYIKFLQAQICVLKSMPLNTSISTLSSSSSSTSLPSSMDSLNREELLGVMINSGEIQTVLSRNGYCLYTVEQMADLLNNKVALTGRPPGDVLPEYLLHGMLWNYY